jgi:hypothetical protein
LRRFPRRQHRYNAGYSVRSGRITSALKLGSLLAGTTAVGLVVLGAVGVVAPRPLGKAYGIEPHGPGQTAYIRALGARDIAAGGALLAALGSRSHPALRGTILSLTIVALGDFTIVATLRGRTAARNLTIHASGAALMVAIWAILGAET